MTTDSHSGGSKEDHNRRKVRKENTKVNGKRMSQEELEKEIVEIKEQIDALRRIQEESQRLGWVLKKKPIKWHTLQKRLQQRQVKWLMGKIRDTELEMEVSICELEQGEVLGEDEYLKTETSSETKGSHDFKSDNLCMIVGETCEEGQFVDIDIKEEEDRQNLNSVLKEDEIDKSHVNTYT